MRVNKSLTVIEALGRLVSFLSERGVKPVEPHHVPGCAAHLVSAASMRKAPQAMFQCLEPDGATHN
jgi:hypothetical protein